MSLTNLTVEVAFGFTVVYYLPPLGSYFSTSSDVGLKLLMFEPVASLKRKIGLWILTSTVFSVSYLSELVATVDG